MTVAMDPLDMKVLRKAGAGARVEVVVEAGMETTEEAIAGTVIIDVSCRCIEFNVLYSLRSNSYVIQEQCVTFVSIQTVCRHFKLKRCVWDTSDKIGANVRVHMIEAEKIGYFQKVWRQMLHISGT